MGTYYYLDDPKSDMGYSSIAKKHGLRITDKMILDEVYKKKNKKAPYGKRTG